MTSYELTLVLNPNLEEKEREGLVSDSKKMIEDKKGAVESIDVWGKRDLAYPIKRQTQGVYVLLTFASESSFVSILDKKLKTEEKVLRHLIVRKEK